MVFNGNLDLSHFSSPEQAGKSVESFPFIKKRVRILSGATEVKEKSNGIVYWMSRDQRIQGELINWKTFYRPFFKCIQPHSQDESLRNPFLVLID